MNGDIMKRRLFHLIFLSSIVLCGCNGALENDINLLERRLNDIQKACDRLNNDIASLGSMARALEQYNFVTDVEVDRTGDYTRYIISMSNGDPIVLHEGKDAVGSPAIGIKLNSDGKYYWTVTYSGEEPQFIRADDGTMVAATAASPQFRIREGKWEVSYNEGRTWTDNYNGAPFGNATGESPQSFFEAVIDSVDYIIFKMKDSTEITVPSWSAYEKIAETVRLANENYKATQSIIEAVKKKSYISKVMPVVGQLSDTIGFRMFLSDGTEMTFYNGVATNRPVIGISRDLTNPSDTAYYWTVKQGGDTTFSWVLVHGNKVRADEGPTPMIALNQHDDGFYYWNVSFNEGWDWISVKDTLGNDVRASLKEKQVMDSIGVMQDYVYIRQGENEYRIERYRNFSVDGVPPYLEMEPGQDTSFTVSVAMEGNSDYSEYEILPVVSDGFVSKAGKKDGGRNWDIFVTAPSNFTGGTLSLIVSDGRGLLKTYTIEITCK